MGSLLGDLRYALRRIRRTPGFSFIAILSLALGIGANTAIFTMVNEILLRGAPYQDVGTLIEIYPSDSGHVGLGALSFPELKDIREGTGEVFSAVTADSFALVNENRPDGGVTLPAEVVSGNYFDVLGIRPAVGRSFLPEEDEVPDARPVVMLGYRFWQARYGGDPQVVGQTIRLNGRPYEIVGVAPADASSFLPGIRPSIWAPTMMMEHLDSAPGKLEERGSHNLFAKGRLRPGVGVREAQAVVDKVVRDIHQRNPEYPDRWGLTLVPTSQVAIHPLLDRVLYPGAAVLLAVVAMVLLIACVNLASFLLARAADRRKEISVRLALGAPRSALIRQLLTETTLLALSGGIAGVAAAWWTLRLFGQLKLPSMVPIDFSMTPDGRVLVFTLALSLLAGLLFGLLPAWQTTNPRVAQAINSESVFGRPPRKINLRNALVVGQVAVSFLLLIGSGLFLRSLQAARSADPGFGREPTAIVWLGLSPDQYDFDKARRFYDQVVEGAASLPGVRAVGLIDVMPLTGTSFSSNLINVDGVEPPPGGPGHEIDRVIVDPGYFEAAGVPLVAGRHFGSQDQPNSPPVVIVSQTMAKRFWQDGSAVGKIIRRDNGREYRVVGIVRDTDVRALGEAPRPYLYYPLIQSGQRSLQIVARTSVEPHLVADQILGVARQIEPDVLVMAKKTMSEHLGFMLFPFRFGGMLLSIFGGLALLLACIGLYGVVRYSAASRTREMGIRMSLGATARSVTGQVMYGGLSLVGIGIVLGLGLSLAAAPLLGGLLFGIEPIDPATFLVVAGVLSAVALASSLGPALKAGRLDPVKALRTE